MARRAIIDMCRHVTSTASQSGSYETATLGPSRRCSSGSGLARASAGSVARSRACQRTTSGSSRRSASLGWCETDVPPRSPSRSPTSIRAAWNRHDPDARACSGCARDRRYGARRHGLRRQPACGLAASSRRRVAPRALAGRRARASRATALAVRPETREDKRPACRRGTARRRPSSPRSPCRPLPRTSGQAR